MVCSICKNEGHNKRTCTKTNPVVVVKFEIGSTVIVKLEVVKPDPKVVKPDPKVVKPDPKVVKPPKSTDIDVNSIINFMTTCKRADNDYANKIREKILKTLDDPPKEYFDDIENGKYWSLVNNEYKNSLKKIAKLLNIDNYTSTQIRLKGGRSHNYDFDLMYYKDDVILGTQKIEFKNGCSKISKLPQFLSLQTKCNLFETSYQEFWYINFLSDYIRCDSGITEAKPSLEDYLKNVGSTTYSITPFFAQLRKRYNIYKKEKNKVVNESITAYLTKYGKDVNLEYFKEKLKLTQDDKIFLMWSNSHYFNIDMFLESEKNDITYSSIKNGNVIQLKSGKTTYYLLLRWKNYKGVLNPAWQISMNRTL